MIKELKHNDNLLNKNIEISNSKNEVIDLIMNGFSTNDPDDPYGNISPKYRDALIKNFGKSQNDWVSVHHVYRENKKAVSIATATYKNKIAFVNNVTTLQNYRGKGIAKQVMQFLENNMAALGVKIIILTTEAGAYTEKFYQKIGYKTFDIWYGYFKN